MTPVEDHPVTCGWQRPNGQLGEVADVYAIACKCGNRASAYAMHNMGVTATQRTSASEQAWACFREEAQRSNCHACKKALHAWRQNE